MIILLLCFVGSPVANCGRRGSVSAAGFSVGRDSLCGLQPTPTHRSRQSSIFLEKSVALMQADALHYILHFLGINVLFPSLFFHGFLCLPSWRCAGNLPRTTDYLFVNCIFPSHLQSSSHYFPCSARPVFDTFLGGHLMIVTCLLSRC